MRITVDTHKCIASGSCVVAAAAVFDQSEEDGIVILLDAEPAPELAEQVRNAARVCPAAAILVDE